VGDHRVGGLVETLAQARCRGHSGDAECGCKERVVAPVLDGIEIALARAQQPDVALHTIGVRNAVAQRDRSEVEAEPREAERSSDDGEP